MLRAVNSAHSVLGFLDDASFAKRGVLSAMFVPRRRQLARGCLVAMLPRPCLVQAVLVWRSEHGCISEACKATAP